MRKVILITGCGGHYMGDLIQCYREIPGIDTLLVGVASEPDEDLKPLLDLYLKVPRCDEDGYYDRLYNLCRVLGVDIIIPSIDDELVPLRNMKEKFAAIGTNISVSDCPGLDIATNKLRFLELMEREGVPHPRYRAFDDPDGFDKAVEEIGCHEDAVCVKALDKAGSRGFRIIDPEIDLFQKMLDEKPTSRYLSFDSFREMFVSSKLRPTMMVQEYLPGDEYSVDLLADHCKVLYMVGRLNTVVDNSIPLESELKEDVEAYEISRRIVELLELDGNVCIDFLYNAEDHIIPIEVNARISATVSLCAKGGVNLPALQVMKMLGMKLPAAEPVYGTAVKKKHQARYFFKKPEGGENDG